ncbi:MAG: DUF4838 domain-containing protein [Clostridia bacterium]|nr:DUF4838 domain-containing protein [Clostridia bacterium]
MLKINKLISASAVDYAAEELKKYLRMMMPEGGDVEIAYDPEAKCGFRLGLMQELGLDISDAEDAELDDILYIDCDKEGGIIAGDNPRSVLLAVYEYLRQMGCRWLMPGVDGEYIPMKDIEPVKYRHKPSMRYRGWCNEGTEFQQCMLDAIELAPKLGLNVFMLEFRIPSGYYTRYYEHKFNENNRPPEPITTEQIIRWKVQCEAEIQKRGLEFHNIGHGFTIDPFKIPGTEQYQIKVDDSIIPEETKKHLALFEGKRGFMHGSIINTNFCMSSEEARRIVVSDVVDYAEHHSNTDYLHVWLSDGQNCHCECAECAKMTPSDWYMVLMNEIDEALTAKGLPTRIVFIAYVDSTWAPEKIRIKNPERFALLIAPITRTYTETLPEKKSDIVLRPYERNKLTFPRSLEEYLAYFDKWKEVWSGSNITYEYHFWRQHFYEVSGILLARRINEDVKCYIENGLSGIIEDASQRAFFPTGLAFYTYARSMFDASLTSEELEEEFFSAAFGKDWKLFRDYLLELSKAIPYTYTSQRFNLQSKTSPYYRPDLVPTIKSTHEVIERGRALIKEHYDSDIRVQTVAVRVLEAHTIYAESLALALEAKAVGDDDRASELFVEMMDKMGKLEAKIERYYDFTQCRFALQQIFNSKTVKPQNEIQDN